MVLEVDGTMISHSELNTETCLSVISPAYNEAENLPQLLKEIAEALAELTEPWEVIIVDDGSTDGTTNVLRKLMTEHPRLRVLSLRQHAGKIAALDAGFRNARGKFIAMIDADLQNDPADIPKMLDLLVSGKCDMVNGWRSERYDNWLRRVSSRVANGVRRWLTGEEIHDSACGLKLFRRECLAEIKLFAGMQRFLAELFRMHGYTVREIRVDHRPRTAGKAKYGVWNRLFVGLRDTFAIRWMQRRMLHYDFQEWER